MRHTLPIAVYGAGGHTGRFVVGDAQRRGLPVVAVGRDGAKLPSGVPGRVAALDEPEALTSAFAGCGVVVHCAGPFLDTATPVVRAALQAGCHYLDVTAEQASARSTFELFDAPARAAGRAVVPAAGFYGGLADLLASALLGDEAGDEVTVAVALDHWWPTRGTRLTGERNQIPRVVVEDGRMKPMPLPAATSSWTFGAPHGEQPVVELPFSEVVTISRHLRVGRLRSWLTRSSLDEIRDPATPAPVAIDAWGRSAQRFEMAVQTRAGGRVRQAVARGQDIYATSAPLVVAAAERMLRPGFDRPGAFALGQCVDSVALLAELAGSGLGVDI